MKKKWNWAILGCGNIAEKFSTDLKTLPQANLYAAASRSFEKADAFAKKLGYEKAFGTYLEMVQDPDVDVVYIASPHSHHLEHTLLCLDHGKAVLCEKAFALNSDQAAQMISKAKEKEVFLMEAFWTRFQPSFLKVKEILESGHLGKIKMMRSDFAFNGPYDPANRLYNLELGGGSLLDIGIYPVFAALMAFGKPEHIVSMADFSPTGSEESIAILFKYKDGSMASLQSSFAVYSDIKSEYFCEKGFVRIKRKGITPTLVEVWNAAENETEEFIFEYPGADGYNYEAEHVMECLDQRKTESDILPLSFSADLMEVLDRIRQDAGIVFPFEK
ncbi:MAG: Gfo/Idh/MocA family oxidoreductase [Bacteroidetes bacterium]|nr:Gfo/Idh/MocA family oxidoreductase [Bacteroidota bacterium]